MMNHHELYTLLLLYGVLGSFNSVEALEEKRIFKNKYKVDVEFLNKNKEDNKINFEKDDLDCLEKDSKKEPLVLKIMELMEIFSFVTLLIASYVVLSIICWSLSLPPWWYMILFGFHTKLIIFIVEFIYFKESVVKKESEFNHKIDFNTDDMEGDELKCYNNDLLLNQLFKKISDK